MGSVSIWGTVSDDAGGDDQLHSKVDKRGDEMHGNLNMLGHTVTGLPTNINLVNDFSDATSYDVCNQLLNNGLNNKIDKLGDTMKGNLYLSVGNNDTRMLGCNDLNDQTGFNLLLGTYYNQIQYERQDAIPQPIKILSSSGTLFQLNGDDYLRVGSDSDTRIIAYKPLGLMTDAAGDHDAVTKTYVDNKARKCRAGLVPYLVTNTDHSTGYEVSASSEFNSNYNAFNAFRYGNYEWATLGVKNNFWIKIKCLEQVRVWRISTIGRNCPNEEFINWRFEGSNNGSNWTILRTESNYPIALRPIGISFVEITNTQYFQYYRLFVVQSNPLGSNPGLKHFQLYVYSE